MAAMRRILNPFSIPTRAPEWRSCTGGRDRARRLARAAPPRVRLKSRMGGEKMADEPKYQGAYPQLVTKIIASYVSHHNVAPEQIPELISSVHRTFDSL